MGLTCAEEILDAGLKRGVNPGIPVAVISNASKENQKVLTSTFNNLPEIAKESEKPAVLVFGEVVNLRDKIYPVVAEKLIREF